MNRSKNNQISRRDFLKVTSAAGGSLLISLYLSGCNTSQEVEITATQPAATASPTPVPPDPISPNMFVEIDYTGLITVTVTRVEMGQGVRTALPMILADEMGAAWGQIQVVTAQADRSYGRQRTTGSHSVEQLYLPLRQAGAVARELLITAAAQTWKVEPERCSVKGGKVIHPETSEQLPFGDLVGPAASLPVPEVYNVTLKDPEEFQIIGKSFPLQDTQEITSGRARYGMDIQLPDMLYASLERCPIPGGRIASYDSTEAEQVPGVQGVLETNLGLAVLADNTWAAFQGRKALDVSWDKGRHADLSTESIRAGLLKRIEQKAESSASLGSKDELLEAVYEVPFLAHATMEPMNCTADVREDSCEVWAPTQDPEEAKMRAVSITKLGTDAVTVHIPLVGGGFGRRDQVDYVEQAVSLSAEIQQPVQVIWTREDDFRHDFLHPFSLSYAVARLDNPTEFEISSFKAENPIPTGIWRSVDNIQDAFAHECFVDELAAAADQDSYTFRRDLLQPNQQAVLDLAVENGSWGEPLSEDMGRGLAFHTTWGATHVAMIAEVRVDENQTIHVPRVVCALDCGLVINPDIVASQIEGAIAMALTFTLKDEIMIANGQVQQSNFHDYPLLTTDEMPEVEVHIVPSKRNPQGVGEMGIPPVAPAVANAVYAATGERIRKLPLELPRGE